MKFFCLTTFTLLVFGFNLYTEDFNSIEQLIDKEQYQTVINKYSDYETKISSYPEIGYYLAIAYFKICDYEKAELIFSELLKQGYKPAQTSFNLGITKYKLKQLNEAIKYLEMSRNYDITFSAESMYVIISCYLLQNKINEAIRVYKELVEKFPYSLQVLKTQELFEKYKIETKKIMLGKEKLKTNFYISAEYGYDNNINMISLEQTSGDSDYYYEIVAMLLLSYKHLEILPSFQKVSYSSFTDYNSDVYSLVLEYNLNKISLGVSGREIKYRELFNYDIGSWIKFNLDPLISLKLYYFNKIYQIQEELNSTIYQASLEMYISKNKEFLLGVNIKRNSGHQIFSYNSVIPLVRISKEVFDFLTTNIELSYEIKNYEWDREDKVFCLNLSPNFSPIKKLQISPRLFYINSSSNKEYLSYEKTEIVVSLSLYF